MTYANPVSVRIPPEVKTWLQARAAENDRSVHGELLAILKATKRADNAKTA